jgi:tetratricopeptide (TPR) repeat protein
MTHFKYTKDLANIESAISNQQKAIQLTPKGHAKLPRRFNNLGILFQAHFEHTADLASIQSAIDNLQKALQLTFHGHADRPGYLNNLGTLFQAHFDHTKNKEDIFSAISSFRSSATHISGPPSIRLSAARKWAHLSGHFYKSQSLDAFHIVIKLLSEVAGLEQTIHKRHEGLVDLSDLTACATAAALEEDGQAETALTWLEQGRCLVWTQLNHLHTSVESLHTYNPSLADRFKVVAQKLEALGSRQVAPSIFSEATMTNMIVMQDEIQTHVHLAKKWNDLLSEIRSIPKFKDFLQPPNASDILSSLPSDGPIVIFNIHKNRCDALALIASDNRPLHIPLVDFGYDQANNLSECLHKYLQGYGVRRQEIYGASDRAIFPYLPPEEDIMNIYEILHKLWEQLVKPILDGLGYLVGFISIASISLFI